MLVSVFIGACFIAGSLYGSWWAIKGERGYQGSFGGKTTECKVTNFGWGYNVIVYEYFVGSTKYMGASHRSFWFADIGAPCTVAFRVERPEQSRLLGPTEDIALSNEDFTSGESARLAIGRAIICGSLPVVAFFALIATLVCMCNVCTKGSSINPAPAPVANPVAH